MGYQYEFLKFFQETGDGQFYFCIYSTELVAESENDYPHIELPTVVS